MENLESVVRERNRAYFELETGENGERPTGEATNCFGKLMLNKIKNKKFFVTLNLFLLLFILGLSYTYKMREHAIEKRFNKKFLEDEKLHNKTNDYKFINDFLNRLREKQKNKQKYINL